MKRLTTKQMTDATLIMARLPDTLAVAEQVNDLYAKVKVFEAVVWFPRLQAQVNGTDSRGMRGKCRDIDVLTWCCAGRCMIQLERAGHRVTIITADDEKPWTREMAHVAPNMGPMGIQGIDAEYVEALKLLYEATRYGNDIVLKPDENVSIG
jgi:hypothetical protein